jgi:chromosome segregation ATPase
MQALERDSVLYQRVIELEQALSERTRALESLLLDDRVLRATVARLDADFVKLQTDLVQEKERSGDLEGSCRALQDELALTESNLRSAVDKNRVLVRVHDVRQKRIEELTGALERRGSSAHEIRQLRAAIHANEAELDSARSAQQVLVKVVRKREEELDQMSAERAAQGVSTGVPFDLWDRERRELQGQLDREQRARRRAEEELAAIRSRADAVAESAAGYDSTDAGFPTPMSPAMNSSTAARNTRRTPSRPRGTLSASTPSSMRDSVNPSALLRSLPKSPQRTPA